MTDKERLENMSPIGFDLNGDVLLRNEDYHWLMEQAERVEELETKLSINTNNMKQLQKENERYKQFIEHFAYSDEDYEGMLRLQNKAKKMIEIRQNGELGQQNQCYREALKNIYELAEYNEYDNTLEQIVLEIEKTLEGNDDE